MKTLSFNQLQIRVFTLILVLFTTIILSYRIWIQLPQLEATMLKLSERELSTLVFAINRITKPMVTLNYDYAVWDESFEFVQDPHSEQSQKYLLANYLDDNFVLQEIDGVFIFDKQWNTLYAKGFHHKNQIELKFQFHDFTLFPENRAIGSIPAEGTEVKSKMGVLSTLFGPAIFISTAILPSEKSLDANGFLVFIRLINQEFIDEISLFTATPVIMAHIGKDESIGDLADWDAEVDLDKLSPFTQRIIRNAQGQPVVKLTLHHSNGQPPSIWGIGLISLVLAMLMLLITVYMLLAGFIIKPVQRLASNIKDMDKVQYFKELPKNHIISELRKISFHFNALVGKVQRQNILLSKLVYVDELTQIANRRAFELHLDTQIQLLNRHNIGLTLILADIDYFKRYNDSLGHLAGDEALKKVATVLEQHFKRAEDICARFGGEEFIMFYSDISAESLQQKLTEIIHSFKGLAIPHPSSKVADYVTVSLGVCQVLTDPDASYNFEYSITGKQIILMADKALYQAKDNGRNQFRKVTILANDIDTAKTDLDGPHI